MSLVAFKIFCSVLSDIDVSEHQPLFFIFNNLFICFWLCWVFLAVPGLSFVAFFSCSGRGLFFVAVLRLLTGVASLVEHGL